MSLQAFRDRLAAHRPVDLPALPGRTNHLRAGVLVPVAWQERPEVLAIVRSDALRQHAGEVAFPGGKPEPGDADLVATALREANEELGLADVEVIGQLSSMPLYTSDFRLVPSVGLVDGRALRPDPGEVAEVLRFDVLDLLARPAWDGIVSVYQGVEHVSPIFELDGHVMYGGTAYTFLETLGLLAAALDRPLPPFAPGRFTWEQLGIR